MKRNLSPALAFIVFATSFSLAQTPTLWGLTSQGGASNTGTIFNYNIATGTDTVKHSFGASDGLNPGGSLLKATNGLLYGLAPQGGIYNKGIIFGYDIATGSETDLHDFGGSPDGNYPTGSLMQSSNGLLYGTTAQGGAFNKGAIFSYDITSDIDSILYSFTGGTADGSSPNGSLIQAYDGKLYGMTNKGGSAGVGIIFRYNILTDSETVLYSFPSNNADNGPGGSLIQASDGKLYGMTANGGTNGEGSIFQYDIATGTYNDVHSFGSGIDGEEPNTNALIQANDGLLYGLTWNGGLNSDGIIFSFNTLTDSETVLYAFGSSANDATAPYGSLMQASDGKLYGMAPSGGTNFRQGAIFSYDIATVAETVIYNFDSTNGGAAYGNLIETGSITAISQVSSNNIAVSAFPNPFETEVYIQYELPEKSETQVSILNMLGGVVYQSQPTQESGVVAKTVNIGMLSKGIYLIQLKVNGNTTNVKACKE